jgi:hypothetical protein
MTHGVVPSEEADKVQTFINSIQVARQSRDDLVDNLPIILAKIADFVSETPCYVYTRFTSLGVLKIGPLWVLSPALLQRWLRISKSRFNGVLSNCLWEQFSLLNVDLGPHLFFFSKLLPSEIRKLSFRKITEIEPMSVILHPLVADRCSTYNDLKLKLARAKAHLKQMKTKMSRLKAQITKSRMKEVFDDLDDEDDVVLQCPALLEELYRLAQFPKHAREFSDSLYELSFVLQRISPKAFRVLRQILPFPSPSSIQNRWGPEKNRIKTCLTNLDEACHLMVEYRERLHISCEIPCVLGADATSMTATGLQMRTNSAHVFTFLILPFRHDQADLLVYSIPHPTGKFDAAVLQMRDALHDMMTRNGFSCHFDATDGDAGVQPIHQKMFKLYEHFTIDHDLGTIVDCLTESGPLIHWPITDLLHLMKNARTRIILGSLAFSATSKVITADSLNATLGIGRPLSAKKPLDLIKDELALELFTLNNLLRLVDVPDIAGAYFMMPFVCLNLAVRNTKLGDATRLCLIQIAFLLFFRMAQNFPQTGKAYGIYSSSREHTDRKTLWSKNMCTRGCNLCIGLNWAIRTHPEFLALGRIGSHSLESHFGMTRSVLRGETRWLRFLSAEVDAILIQRLLVKLDMRSYIRRIRTISGFTLGSSIGPLADVEVGEIQEKAEMMAILVMLDDEEDREGNNVLVMDVTSLLWFFVNLSTALSDVGDVEKVAKSSRTSGACAMNRYFAGTCIEEEVADEPVITDEPEISPDDAAIIFETADE